MSIITSRPGDRNVPQYVFRQGAPSRWLPRLDWDDLPFNVRQALKSYQFTQNELPTLTPAVVMIEGFASNIGTGGFTTVGEFPAGRSDDEFPSSNVYNSIVSDNASDVGSVRVFGTSEGDNVRSAFAVYVDLTGTTPVIFANPFSRVIDLTRTANPVAPSMSLLPLVGNVSVFFGGASAGVPDVASQVGAMITAGEQISRKVSYTTITGQILLIDSVSVSLGQAAAVDARVSVTLETRPAGGVWLPLVEGLAVGEFSPPLAFLVHQEADFRARAISSAANTPVYVRTNAISVSVPADHSGLPVDISGGFGPGFDAGFGHPA